MPVRGTDETAGSFLGGVDCNQSAAEAADDELGAGALGGSASAEARLRRLVRASYRRNLKPHIDSETEKQQNCRTRASKSNGQPTTRRSLGAQLPERASG